MRCSAVVAAAAAATSKATRPFNFKPRRIIFFFDGLNYSSREDWKGFKATTKTETGTHSDSEKGSRNVVDLSSSSSYLESKSTTGNPLKIFLPSFIFNQSPSAAFLFELQNDIKSMVSLLPWPETTTTRRNFIQGSEDDEVEEEEADCCC